MEVCRQLTNLALVERVREPGRSSSCHFGSRSSARLGKTKTPPRARQLHQQSYPQRNQSPTTRGHPRPGSRNLYHLTDSRMPGSCSPCHHKGSRKLRNIKTRQQTVRSGPCPGSCKHRHAVTANAGSKPAASPARLANSVVSRGRQEITEAEIA